MPHSRLEKNAGPLGILAFLHLAVLALAFDHETDLPGVTNTLADFVVSLAPTPYSRTVWHVRLAANLGKRFAILEKYANSIEDFRLAGVWHKLLIVAGVPRNALGRIASRPADFALSEVESNAGQVLEFLPRALSGPEVGRAAAFDAWEAIIARQRRRGRR